MIDPYPNVTPAKLARLRRLRPLASLPRGIGTALPTAHVGKPLGVGTWELRTNEPVSGRIAFVVAEFAFEAIKQAARQLGCEPGAFRVWGFEQ